MRRMRPKLASLIVVAALGASACANEEDAAAKARIFSPEDPPQVLQAARETLVPEDLDDDPALVNRIFAISAQEAAARIGPHVQEAEISFRWTAEGQDPVRLAEERMVALGEEGDFHARIHNDQKQGMEWVKVDGVSYARSRYARFRERRRDRGSSEHVVASAYATLSTFRDWVHGAVKLTPAGEKTVGGRKGLAYSVSLGEVREKERLAELPEVVFPEGGPDEETRMRLAALEKGRPTSITGTLVVDAKTAVPLAADLQAAVVVPPEGEQAEARLELRVDLEVKDVGEKGKVEVPEHIKDAPRPPGVVATLQAYGIPTAAEKAAAARSEADKTGENPPPEEE